LKREKRTQVIKVKKSEKRKKICLKDLIKHSKKLDRQSGTLTTFSVRVCDGRLNDLIYVEVYDASGDNRLLSFYTEHQEFLALKEYDV